MTIIRVDPHDTGRSVAEQVRENIRRIVALLLEDRATTKILLSDAVGVDPSFDRKLQSFFGEIASLLEGSIRDGQDLGIVAKGDARLLAFLTMGALREVMFQIVARGAEYDQEKLVEAMFAFFGGGYLRVDEAPRAARSKATASARARGR